MNGRAQALVATAMLVLLGWIVLEQRSFRSFVTQNSLASAPTSGTSANAWPDWKAGLTR